MDITFLVPLLLMLFAATETLAGMYVYFFLVLFWKFVVSTSSACFRFLQKKIAVFIFAMMRQISILAAII